MKNFKCSFLGCNEDVTAHYIQMEGRAVVAQGHLCEEHGSNCLHGYWKSRKVGAGTAFRNENGIAFEPGLVFFHEGRDERGPLTHLYLIETGGCHQLGMGIGRFEGESLALELQHYKAQRPLPHREMVALMEALGGKLLFVVIDKFVPAEQILYEAKLHIQHASKNIIIDVRPSDAVTLAVICDVPILVSDPVLATLT